jgi:hypothetical protein
MKRVLSWLILFLAIAGIGRWLMPKRFPPGILTPAAPMQTAMDQLHAPITAAGFTLQPLARFECTVRVLGLKRYWSDPVSKLSPYDLAVGWGPMSDQSILDQLKISQGNRFFFWRYQNPPPLPVPEITAHATNMHLIPATRAIRWKLRWLSKGDLIHMRGLLVEAQMPGMPPWRSSMSRMDSGKGACEIVWVESVEPFDIRAAQDIQDASFQ